MIDTDALDSKVGFDSEQKTNTISPSEMKQKKLQLRQNQLVRENRRLRNSASFRIGKRFTKAATQPWRLPFLPFSVIYLIFSIGMERLGRWGAPVDEKGTSAVQNQEIQDSVIFFPTNGVGFGHFTRMYALAKRFKKYSPSTEIVFFTTMPTLHLLYNEGFVTYHVAGRKKYNNISASEWNTLVEEHLSLAIGQHQPSTFIFDGAFPYRGMLNAIREKTAMRKIWMRRGTFKKGSRVPVDSIAHFDTIIHPEDSVALAPNEIDHGVESITCAPIVLLDEDDLLPRNTARRRLNLPLKGRVVYVQLGAGRINDIDSEIRRTVEALLEHDDVTVVVGESMLGERIELSLERVVLLRDYPNSMYFNAFDATVQAGGYNSFHETRRFGLPALFYPNMNTGMDDQLARCRAAENEGWGHVIVERNKDSIRNGIEHLLTIKNSKPLEPIPSGATELYTNLTKHDVGKYNEGWMLPKEAINWIENNIPPDSKVLEFGSGDASQSLARQFELYSVEHDSDWLGKTTSNYIYAPIVDNETSTRFDQEGWYHSSLFDEIPNIVELIIIDGPPGKIGRAGILEHLARLPKWKYMLIDDTDRVHEQELIDQLCKFFNCKVMRMSTQQFKSNGDVRMFDILERR
tara:strand:+ start:2447 stop:4339 length:1893 start_codon:yes stop_codon:yes gene_type:complete